MLPFDFVKLLTNLRTFLFSNCRRLPACLVIALLAWRLGRVVKTVYSALRLYLSPVAAILRLINSLIVVWTRNDTQVALNYTVDEQHVPPRTSNNGHPESGARRDAARRLIEGVALNNGLSQYILSGAQVQLGIPMVLPQLVPQDLYCDCAADPVPESSLLVGIDVDYYIQDFRRLFTLGRPIVFYTFNPVRACGADDDTPYTIDSESVVYRVSGGGAWSHEVWDWRASPEFVTARDNGWIPTILGFLGMRKVHIFKRVVYRPFVDNEQRVLVWLLPTFSIWEIGWLPSSLTYSQAQRMVYTDPERTNWNRIEHTLDDGKIEVSIGLKGGQVEMSLGKDRHDLFLLQSTNQSLASRMVQEKKFDSFAIATFQAYVGNMRRRLDPQQLIGAPAKPRVLPFVPTIIYSDPDETAWRAISGPLLDEVSYVPMIKRFEALEASLRYRVFSKINTRVPCDTIKRFGIEFVTAIVDYIKDDVEIPLVPYGLEETMGFLDKPTQVLAIKRILDTVDVPPRELIEAFIKNEATRKPSRLISAFPDVRFLLEMSRYTLKARDAVFHKLPFFVPGKNPKEIASVVQQYATSVEGHLVEGDFSSFDGTVSAWLQKNIINATYLQLFAESDRAGLGLLLAQLISAKGRAKRFGFRYEPGPGVKSGSPTTCDGNTILNAFLMYVAIRRSFALMTPREALLQIGLAFGDDSLFSSVFQDEWIKVVSQVNMKLKIEIHDPRLGTCFLGRVYPDPVNTVSSFQDPVRTLRKLHLTSRNMNIPLADAAMDRVEGYLDIDEKTPVISSYCRAVQRHFKDLASRPDIRARRRCATQDKPYWVYERGSWPQQDEDAGLILNCLAFRLGQEPEVIQDFDARLENLPNVNDVPRLMLASVTESVVGAIDEEGVPHEAPDDSTNGIVRTNNGYFPDNHTNTQTKDGGAEGAGTHETPRKAHNRRGKDAGQLAGSNRRESQPDSKCDERPASETKHHPVSAFRGDPDRHDSKYRVAGRGGRGRRSARGAGGLRGRRRGGASTI